MDALEKRYDFLTRQDDVRECETVSARRGALDVLLCRYRGRIYAFENRCPHQGKPMDGARIRNGQLVCPHHGARFTLDTGRGDQVNARLCLKALDIRLTATDVEIHDGAL